MPDAETPRVCPYLRSRTQVAPVLTPNTENHCILAASIHLPQSQQSRFCLGGQHVECSRFVRQQERPLPKYVTGVSPQPVRPTAPVKPLPTLWWRRPWGRALLRIVLAALLVTLLALSWRWRSEMTPPRVTPRPPLPTAIPVPTATPNQLYYAPTVGPDVR